MVGLYFFGRALGIFILALLAVLVGTFVVGVGILVAVVKGCIWLVNRYLERRADGGHVSAG